MRFPHVSNVKTWLNYDWFHSMMDHAVPYLFSPDGHGEFNFIWHHDIKETNTDVIQGLLRDHIQMTSTKYLVPSPLAYSHSLTVALPYSVFLITPNPLWASYATIVLSLGKSWVVRTTRKHLRRCLAYRLKKNMMHGNTLLMVKWDYKGEIVEGNCTSSCFFFQQREVIDNQFTLHTKTNDPLYKAISNKNKDWTSLVSCYVSMCNMCVYSLKH